MIRLLMKYYRCLSMNKFAKEECNLLIWKIGNFSSTDFILCDIEFDKFNSKRPSEPPDNAICGYLFAFIESNLQSQIFLGLELIGYFSFILCAELLNKPFSVMKYK